MKLKSCPGSAYLRGSVWWYVVRLPDGTRRPVSLETELKGEVEYLAKREYGQAWGKSDASPTMKKLVAAFRANEAPLCCDAHLITKVAIVNRFISHMAVESPGQIDAKLITAYYGKRFKEVSASTVKNERGALGRFCKWLTREGHLPHNPVVDTEAPKDQSEHDLVYLDQQELDAARAFARQNKMYPVLVVSYTALRRAEIMRLRWSDIHAGGTRPTISVRMRKGREWKTVALPIHPGLLPIIKDMPRVGDAVFESMSRKQWADYLNPLRNHIPKLAMPGQGWQTFRRTVASLLLTERGARLEDVSKILRHSNTATTEKSYARLVAEHARGTLASL